MTAIPGTSYQITGSQIQTMDGQAISQEEFLQKVKGGEINLTANSLQVISSHFGPDLTKSLELASSPPAPVGSVLGNVGAAEQPTFNLFGLMVLMHEATQKMRESEAGLRDAQFNTQIQDLKDSASAAHEAAYLRMIAGCVSGTMSIVGGASSVYGGVKGATLQVKDPAGGGGMVAASSTDKDAFLKAWGGWSSLAEGGGKIGSTMTEFFGAAAEDQKAKNLDAASKAAEMEVAKARDMMDSLREMNAKVRETLQAVVTAESDAGKSVARM